ncbi:hypothetical protein K523DRAFT_297417 [Schizophyllum commune Tattone D]|nr:hypothetical protein K523DRAFT_297417 [Schizophyllum commune Tattone D]
MPLPENQQIAVKPNAAEVRNKHAITLRMSEDLIEALMANPANLSFEFNTPNQGIYVNDQCFGLSLAKEQSPHELFMQMPQHRDRSLKHYADISHRFTVSAASLDEAAKKLRVATEEANKQRQERKVVMLDDPPLSTSTTAAKKAKPAARKQVASSSTPRPSGTQPAQPPPPPSRPLSAIDPGLRHRVVQCLASAARTADELVKLVCGSASDDRKRGDVRTIMQDVAEARDGLWRLSNKGWLEVQPYKCRTEADRQQALRKATAAFKALKIPESDPRWENLSPPKPAPKPMLPPPPAPAASTSAARHPLPAKPPAPEVKRSTATKEKKPRAKPETKEIMMKDERRPPSVPSPAGLSKPKELPKSSSTPLPGEPPRPARVEALSAATARRPGSGYKAPKSLTPPLRTPTSTSTDKRDELPAANPSMRASTSKAPAAARPSSTEPSRSSSAHHTPTPQPRDRERTVSSSQPARPRTDSKERASAASGSSRPRESELKKPADDVRRHAMKREEEETPPKKLTTKRKVPARYDYSDSDSEDERQRAKRRKVAEGTSRPSAPTKKSDPPVKVKRSDSPVPLPPPPARSRNPERDNLAALGRIQKKERPVPPARLASEQSTSSSSSHKRRRASTPHFTSSEEEGEDPSEREMQRPAKKKALAKEKERERERDRGRDRSRDRDRDERRDRDDRRERASPRPTTKPRKSRPPTADGLQEEYQAKYMEYYPVAMADRKQRAIIQRLLDAASDESVDEDGLLSEGEGKALHANHLRLRGELLELEKQYTKLAPAAA